MIRHATLALPLLALLISNAIAQPFKSETIAQFNEPWAMTFLPDGRLLVTEKRGALWVVTQEGEKSRAVRNVPDVDYRGQGGLGDVILHPEFESNNRVYLSYAEAGIGNTRGGAVASATLGFDERDRPYLSDVQVIWRQLPKVSGAGHYGHRLAFDDEGYLFISSGDRQKFDPAQDMQSTIGKMVRLTDAGRVPADNPFYDKGGITAEIWSLGHRNPLGIAFDEQGRLWSSEMGPLHGDELNLIKRGLNYGYPIVSDGDHYGGAVIPDHSTRPEFEAPKVSWTPTIAPGGMVVYTGSAFPDWTNSALIAGLKSRAIIRVDISGEKAQEVDRYDMGARIRELEQGPNGNLWVLEDRDGARLLKLSPSE